MANLVPCKSCKHEVSKSAKSCPNCGESSPGVTSKDHLLGCLGIIVLLVVVIGLMESCSGEEENSNQATEQFERTTPLETKSQDSKNSDSEIPEFDMTIDQFAERYSQSMSALGIGGSFEVSGETTQNNVLTGTLVGESQNIGVSIFATPETKALQSAIFVGTGDGSQQSGLEVTFGAVALVMALEDPKMPQEERKNILKNLGLLNGEIFEVDKLSFERNGVRYTAMYSDVTGLFVTADKSR